MVRALIFALFSTFASLSQDSVSVFKIRPPELRIEGLFCNDYAITEGTKTMYYLTYEGDAYQFETKLTQEDFYKELIKEQNDLPYEKGTYSLHRKNEKAIIKMVTKRDTSFLLGKYRSGKFFLVPSDTIIITKKWNVGSFIIKIIEKNPEEKKKPVMKTMDKSIYSKNCPNEIFWHGELISLELNPEDTAEYKKLKRFIRTIPLENIHKFEKNKFEYYEEKHFAYLMSDSQAIYKSFFGSCEEIINMLDTIPKILTCLKKEKRFGVKNYFIPGENASIWIAKQGCEVNIKFYQPEETKKILNLPDEKFFDKLKKIELTNTIKLEKTCGFE